MTLQNVRSLLWRGEDLGFGGGNTREVITPSQVVAAARPNILTRAFTGSLDISALLATASPYSTVGRNRILVNRNPRYWLTATIALASSGTNVAMCAIPIAPLASLFLPQNINSCVVSANTPWPLPQPPSGATTAAPPIATSTNTLTFDLVIEQ